MGLPMGGLSAMLAALATLTEAAHIDSRELLIHSCKDAFLSHSVSKIAYLR